MCLGSLTEQSLEGRQAERRKCVGFYIQGCKVVEENAKDMLNSMLNKLDYSEL